MSKKTMIYILIALFIIGAVYIFNRNRYSSIEKKQDDIAEKAEPHYLTAQEKEIYGITIEGDLFVEIVPGGKNSIGPLPKIYLPAETIKGPPPPIDENLDTDKDGIKDVEELKIYGTNHELFDTDGDGIKDGDEIK